MSVDQFETFLTLAIGFAVAGLIASKAGYLAGITQRTTVLGVKVHGMSRQNCLGVYLDGIYWAADHGADVIHLSIPLEWDAADSRYPTAVARTNAALDYAHERGAVLVAAAGNGVNGIGTDLDQGSRFRFCEGHHVICVGATGTASEDLIEEPYWDEITAYSNFGSDIDVVGPGGTTAVPVSLTCSRVSKFSGAPQAPCREGGPVWQSTGTSFGAAVTSGLAALLTSMRPDASADEIESLIERSAQDLGVAGWDRYYGHGRIDVKRAVTSAVP